MGSPLVYVHPERYRVKRLRPPVETPTRINVNGIVAA